MRSKHLKRADVYVPLDSEQADAYLAALAQEITE